VKSETDGDGYFQYMAQPESLLNIYPLAPLNSKIQTGLSAKRYKESFICLFVGVTVFGAKNIMSRNLSV
jgi:hypothetical protein